MNFLKSEAIRALRLCQLPAQPNLNSVFKRYRKPSACDVCYMAPDKRPCFDMRKVTIQSGNMCNAKLVKSFLYSQYWPREPSVCGLWMSLSSPYLDLLSDKYSTQFERFLAFEQQERTNELRLVGVCVALKVYPWMIEELEEWAHYTTCTPDRHRMYFIAHCQKAPNIFKKYHVDFFYDIQVLGTAAEVTGQGVATRLLYTALAHAKDARYSVVCFNSLSEYTKKCAARCGMKPEWSLRYADYVDEAGLAVFYPRRPHLGVTVYTRTFDLSKGGRLPCGTQIHQDAKVIEPPGQIYP